MEKAHIERIEAVARTQFRLDEIDSHTQKMLEQIIDLPIDEEYQNTLIALLLQQHAIVRSHVVNDEIIKILSNSADHIRNLGNGDVNPAQP